MRNPFDWPSGPFPAGFAPTLAALFSNGEQGKTFEPWDMTTLYQDRAGTTPVTAVGQSVGLRMDKSQGMARGPELVANGDFSTDTVWSKNPGWTISGGSAIFTPGTSGFISQALTNMAGKILEVTITVASGTAVFLGSQYAWQVNLTAGTHTVKVSPAYNSLPIWANTSTVIDSISVREIAGNHDVAVSDAARGVYGREPKSGTRNLLTWTEDLSNAVWVANGATKSLVSGKQKLVESVGSGLHGVRNSGGFPPVGAFTTVVRLEAAERSLAEIWIGNSSPSVGAGVRFDLSNGTFVSSRGVGGGTVTDYEITEFSPGVYDCSVTISHGTNDTQTHIFAIASGTATSTLVYTGDGVSGIYIHRAQLEPGPSATAYQKVTNAYDVTEAGVADCYYVQTDGVNDAYVTPTITPGTDKAQIFMGLKKLNDSTSILMELSASAGPNAGTFYALTGPDTGPLGSVNGYSSLSRGSAAATALQTAQIVQAAPDYAVIVATHDIAGDLSTIERNGVAGTSGTADKGTGNFLAYPVYVYARGGTTLPAAVRDYGHAFRFGPNLSASAIAQARTLIAANTPTVTL